MSGDQLALFADPTASTAAPIPATATPRKRRGAHPAQDLVGRKHWRGIRATWCRACKRPTLSGLDADECALSAKVDATPVTAVGEAMALLAGRATYTLRLDLARSIVLLERRTASTITRRPAGGACGLPALAWDVHAEHQCAAIDAQALAATSRLAEAQPDFDPDAHCPF